MTICKPKYGLRTAVLTRGFDPSLSVGSARPAVFRSSTYVFASPESAERAFAMTTGKIQPLPGQRPDLIYSRISHPNAEILEDQIVPLEAGATAAAVFNSGMAAIMTAFFTLARHHGTIVYTTPLYGGTTGLIHQFLEPFGVKGIAVPSGDAAAFDAAIGSAENCCIVLPRNARQPDPDHDRHRARRGCGRAASRPACGHGGQHLSGACLSASVATGRRPGAVFRHQVPVRVQRHAGRRGAGPSPELIQKIRSRRVMFGNILQPDECWMLDSRLPTVALRMNRQSKNAQRLAEALHGGHTH